jgi:preprotein translocase subunit SecD
MRNAYPVWVYALIAVAILAGGLYALPNIFPEDPAVQVSNTRTGEVDPAVASIIDVILSAQGLEARQVEEREGQLLLRYDSADHQLRSADVLRGALDDDHVVALNPCARHPAMAARGQWPADVPGAGPARRGALPDGGGPERRDRDRDGALHQRVPRATARGAARLRDVERSARHLTVTFASEQDRAEALTWLRRQYRAELSFLERGLGEDSSLEVTLDADYLTELRRLALQQNISTLRKRVDELGVAEPIIAQQGESRIVVQLPGVQDTARAKEILGATATLEFRMVAEGADAREAQQTGRAPSGTRLYLERDGAPVLLQRRVMLTGDYITGASSGIAQDTGGPAVFINLDGQGARIFSRVTAENVGRLMATVFIETTTETIEEDGELVRRTSRSEEVINIARINEPLGRRFQITGLESTREAHNLALLLRAGALAAPMSIVEERTVGPSLGQENIDRGMQSVIIGFIGVMLFMVLYYRVFGLIANFALALNLVLIVSILSLLQATLTLPGIAGIVLVVGIAVDANVLIFERIREELRNGMSPQGSDLQRLRAGVSTIADANVTTLIAAVVLFLFGTGPIKGFAITLSIGVVVSMFTAIVVTRAIVNLTYGRQRRIARLSI